MVSLGDSVISLSGLFAARSSSLRPMIFAADAALNGEDSALLRVATRAVLRSNWARSGGQDSVEAQHSTINEPHLLLNAWW